jgi:hypothetical protein
MSDADPSTGSTEVGGDVRADRSGVAAGRDITGGVHTGTEYKIFNISMGELLRDKDMDEVLDAVQKVKQAFQQGGPEAVRSASAASAPNAMPMQAFQARMADPYQGGTQWLPQLRQVAAQQGSAWVPPHTEGLAGINLTGVWVPPGNTWERDYVRQTGPYLNMITGVGAMQTGYSEGLLDPASGIVRLAGRYANGVPLQAQLQLFPNWTLQGWVSMMGPFGPVTSPVFLMKAA